MSRSSALSIDETPDTDLVERHLRAVVEQCVDPPLIDELDPADVSTPCGQASIARAALCWLAEKSDDAIRTRLREELADNDRLAGWRLRRMSNDLALIDWQRIRDVDAARAGGGDARYRRAA